MAALFSPSPSICLFPGLFKSMAKCPYVLMLSQMIVSIKTERASRSNQPDYVSLVMAGLISWVNHTSMHAHLKMFTIRAMAMF